MYSFNINNNSNFDYEKMKNRILIAIKYTSEKYGISVNENLRNTIYEIIVNKQYDYITRDRGLRSEIKQYTSDDFVDLICHIAKQKSDSLYNGLVVEHDNKYYISEDTIKYLIEFCCNYELLPLINNLNIQTSSYNEKQNQELKSENVKYNKPSDELRNAILTGKQTSLSNSSYISNGMYAYSDVGLRRKNQEDSYYIGVHPNNSDFKIMMVADGMGGVLNGEIASNMVIKEIMLWFENLPSQEYYNFDNQQLSVDLQKKIIEIHKKLCNTIEQGGTTLCLSIKKNNSILMCNIGDSQGYVMKDGKLIFATTPENIPTVYWKIPSSFSRYHVDNNVIMSCIGPSYNNKYPVGNFNNIKLHDENNYKVILCSDGVSDCMTDEDIINIARKSNNPASDIVKMAITNDSYIKKDLMKADKETKEYIKKLIEKGEMHEHINGGKDNTTALVGEINNSKKL